MLTLPAQSVDAAPSDIKYILLGNIYYAGETRYIILPIDGTILMFYVSPPAVMGAA
jgi:hypothetical protein